MSRRRSVACIALLSSLLLLYFSLSSRASAQPGQKLGPGFGQRYLVLAASLTTTMQKELRQAAVGGYRVVAGWSAADITSSSFSGQNVVLLEKVAAPPAIYDYLLLETIRGSTLEKEIKEAGARGYRLLPDVFMEPRIRLMEKPPGPSARYDYAFVPHEFALDPATWDGVPVSLQTIDPGGTTMGYSIVATSCSSTTSGDIRDTFRFRRPIYPDIETPAPVRHVFIAEKIVHPPGDVTPGETDARSVDRYLLLNVAYQNDFMEPVRRAARSGYRLVFADPTCGGGMVAVMERRQEAAGAARPGLLPGTADRGYEYVVVNGQEQLSLAAAAGFHPHPSGVIHDFGTVMERAPGTGRADRYLILEKQHSSRMQEQLIDAGRAGLQVVAASRTAHTVIVRQRIGRTVDPATASADTVITQDARPRVYLQPMDGLREHVIFDLRKRLLGVVLVPGPEYAHLEVSTATTVRVPTREQVVRAFTNALKKFAVGLAVIVPTIVASGACHVVVPPPLSVLACMLPTSALLDAESKLLEKFDMKADPDALGLFSKVDARMTVRDVRTGAAVLEHSVHQEHLWFLPAKLVHKPAAEEFAAALKTIGPLPAPR